MLGNENKVSSPPDEEKIRTVPSLDKGSANTRTVHLIPGTGTSDRTTHVLKTAEFKPIPKDSMSAVSSPERANI